MDRKIGAAGGQMVWLTCPCCGTKMVGTPYMPREQTARGVFPSLEAASQAAWDRHVTLDPVPLASITGDHLDFRKGVNWEVTSDGLLEVSCPKKGCARKWSVGPDGITIELMWAIRKHGYATPFPTAWSPGV